VSVWCCADGFDRFPMWYIDSLDTYSLLLFLPQPPYIVSLSTTSHSFPTQSKVVRIRNSIMKAVSMLVLLALSANAAVVKRQAGGFTLPAGLDKFIPDGFDISSLAKSLPKGGMANMMNPTVRMAFKVEEIKPTRMPEAKRVRLTYGPYKIKAANVSPCKGFVS
jgi:hypothetical protein